MDNKELAQKIVQLVGGTENIKGLTHCITRLRFNLKDEKIANTKEIEKLDVLGVQVQGGQYQVIVGNAVVKVYREILKAYPELDSESTVDDGQKMSIIDRVLDTVSGILVAALPPIIGGGMLMGVSFILTNYGIIDTKSNIYFVLNIMANCMFTFMPFLLAVSSAKKFKTNEYMALALAGALMFPSLVNGAAEKMEALKFFNFLTLPIIDYTSSVIPIILAVWLQKYVYGFFENVIPSIINTIFTPMLTLIVMIPVMLIVIAPIGYYGGNYVAYAIEWAINTVPWLAGFLIGSTRPFLVLAGMHHAIRPIQYQQIATFGYTTITPANFMSTMAQATAFLGTYLLVKDKKAKQISLSATVSGFLGITEPGIYGILIKYRAAMVGAFVGGGLGGMVSTMMGAKAYASAMPSILTIPVFMGGGAASIFVGLAVTFVSTLAITYLTGKTIFKIDDPKLTTGKEAPEQTPAGKTIEVYSPIKGNIYPMQEVNDDTFAKKLLGEGIVIMPTDNKVVSPIDAEVKTIFHTNHAIGLQTKEGIEVLIHIGIDTVKLEGQYFTSHIKAGDIVKKGDTLVEFDLDAIKAAGYDPSIIVVITNTKDYLSVVPEFDSGIIFDGEKILTVIS